MCQTDKCVVAQGLKVLLIINLIIIDHSRMIQAFRFIEIPKYDDGSQLRTPANLCLEAVETCLNEHYLSAPNASNLFGSFGGPSPEAVRLILGH